jgi:hypothetical protein
MNTNAESSVDDPFPFNLWLLKVDKETQSTAGSLQVVYAPSQMLVTELIDTLQFD